MDLRGSGGSQATAAGYDETTLAGDLDRQLAGVDGPVSVVGHDMGAGVAFAAAHPGRVRRLVFAEFVLPGFGFAEAPAPPPDHENWQLGFLASATDMAERLLTGSEQDLISWCLGHGDADPDAADDLAHYTRALTRPGALHATMDYFAATWTDAEHNGPRPHTPCRCRSWPSVAPEASAPEPPRRWARSPSTSDPRWWRTPGTGSSTNNPP